jgi:hypothetical protein
MVCRKRSSCWPPEACLACVLGRCQFELRWAAVVCSFKTWTSGRQAATVVVARKWRQLRISRTLEHRASCSMTFRKRCWNLEKKSQLRSSPCPVLLFVLHTCISEPCYIRLYRNSARGFLVNSLSYDFPFNLFLYVKSENVIKLGVRIA